jgi:hypothetical protein
MTTSGIAQNISEKPMESMINRIAWRIMETPCKAKKGALC